MPKRLTDTDKWKKPFIRSLPTEYKLLWLYLLDDCDHAGIWQVDFEIAQIKLGTKLAPQKALGFFAEKIVELDGGTKWFVPDFISFQYGVFNEANKMYKSILPIIKKYNLIPHISSINGVKEMVMDKVMVKEEGGVGEGTTWDQERGKFLNGGDWIFKFCNDKKIKLEEFDQKAKEFLSDLELKADYKPIKEIRRHFTNWYNKQKNGNQFKQDENGRSKAISAREKHDEEKLKKSGI